MNLHRFDVQTIKNVELRRKPFKTAKLQKWSKYNDFHRFDVKNFKTTKVIKLHEFHRFDVQTIRTTQNNESDQITMNLHRFDVQTIYNVEVSRKNFKTTQNCKSIQITMNYIYITSKWSKMLLCRKTFQTPENYKSDQIGRQNEQNVELRRKIFKTTLNYKSDQNTMTCIDLMSKRSKQRKTPNAIKLRWICIDLTS